MAKAILSGMSLLLLTACIDDGYEVELSDVSVVLEEESPTGQFPASVFVWSQKLSLYGMSGEKGRYIGIHAGVGELDISEIDLYADVSFFSPKNKLELADHLRIEWRDERYLMVEYCGLEANNFSPLIYIEDGVPLEVGIQRMQNCNKPTPMENF